MEERLMNDEGKRRQATELLLRELRPIMKEQLDWCDKLHYEIGRPQLPRWASFLLAMALMLCGDALLKALTPPPVLDGILRVMLCLGGVALFLFVPRKRRAGEFLFWADDLQRMPLFAGTILLAIHDRLKKGDPEEVTQIILGFTDAQQGFEPTAVDTPWRHAARHPEEVEGFQRLVHLIACVYQRLPALGEDIDMGRLEVLQESRLGASRYPLPALLTQLDALLKQ